MHNCENCDKPIGKLETAHVWRDQHVVCGRCLEWLRDDQATHRPVQTIEQTGKRWKALMIVGFLVMLVGCPGTMIMATTSSADQNDTVALQGLALMTALAILGMVICVIARVGAWWNHG